MDKFVETHEVLKLIEVELENPNRFGFGSNK